MRRLVTAIAAVLALAAPATAAAVPPVVTFTAQPSGVVTQSSFNFEFSADDAAATLTCSLDGAAAETCASPHTVSGLTDGSHTLTVFATNATTETGNAASSFTVDATAPAAPVITAPADNSVQKVATVTLSGTAEPGSSVAVDGSAPYGPATADASGNWTLTIPTVAEGVHTYTATATDAAGHTSLASATKTVTVDTVAPPAPTVTAPANGALIGASPVTFTGNAVEAGTVTISEGAGLPVTLAANGAWSTPVPVSGDAAHTYNVTLTDAAGNVSPATPVTFTLDTTAPLAPSIISPVNGAAQSSATVRLFGTAEAGAKVTVRVDAIALGNATADGGGNWTFAVGVSPGTHSFTATATDAANHEGPASTPRAITADPNAPAAPVVTGGPDAFAIVAPGGTTLDCRLDTATGQGLYGPCPLSYPGLAPGDYILVARATNPPGNFSTAEFPFTVAGVQPSGGGSGPVAGAATPTPAAVASFGKTVVLRPSSGRTLIRLPKAAGFQELKAKTAVPVETIVDARKGVVVLTAAPSSGAKTESAKFSGGVFTVTQSSAATQLALSETLRCGRTRKLTGDGAGAFRIRGRYVTATGRGAKWLVEDSCKSSIVRVSRGVVAVRGARSSKTVLVRAGRHYTAKR
jgi:hypothetical protein